MAIQEQGDLLRIISYIILSTAIIFYIDIITPLGLVVWILYLIPLFLTIYLTWKYAPLLATIVFILLISVSYFISPLDTSILFAIFNRVFFSLMLIITSLFIWSYKKKVEELRLSEERYRYLAEWSPDAIMVYRKGKILYANPAGVRLLGAKAADELIGNDLVDVVDPAERDLVRERLNQAALGARMALDRIRILRPNGEGIFVKASLGEIIWDDEMSVQIILHEISERKP
jgi:PAS domain S-box-containing protein